MTLEQLHNEFCANSGNWDRLISLYNKHFVPAIMDKGGLTEAQAKIVAAKAWEDGHSYGYTEVIGLSYSLVRMAKELLATK